MNKNGFSLVELSIVLVILGLLTGGILSGQSLIRAAELRSVVSEHQNHMTAIQTFRDKYFAVPGDFKKATQFWGRMVNAAHCVTNSSAAVNAAGACDGDGDGIIDDAPAASQSGENLQIWRHLALAGLIEGTYSGLAGTAGIYHTTGGVNTPKSRLNSAAWFTDWDNFYPGDANSYAMDYGTFFQIGGERVNAAPDAPILRPEEAWNIDTKVDDGRPGLGKLVAVYWDDLCATGGADETDLANSVYNLTDSSLQCVLIFVRAF